MPRTRRQAAAQAAAEAAQAAAEAAQAALAQGPSQRVLLAETPARTSELCLNHLLICLNPVSTTVDAFEPCPQPQPVLINPVLHCSAI